MLMRRLAPSSAVKHSLLLAALALLPCAWTFGVSAQAPTAPPRDVNRAGTTATAARIRGRVLAADTGQPLGRAQVILRPPSGEARNTLTDAEGRFEFAQLPSGAFTLSASKTGYVNLQYGQRRPNEPGKPISVASGETVDRIDISLPRGSVITVRITDDLGFPLARVDVTAQRFQYRSDGRRTLTSFYEGGSSSTNDRGEIRLFGLMPGEYVVQAVARSALPPSRNADGTSEGYTATFYPGVISAGEALPVSLGIGEEKSVQFSIARVQLARISGVVVDSSGRPARDARVTLSSETGTMLMGSASADTNGVFTVENVPPGEYTVSVSSMADEARTTLSVSGADVSDVRITVGPGTTIYGRLAFAGGARPISPSSNVVVAALSIDTSSLGTLAGRRSGPADATGRFGFTGAYGRVLFDVTPPDGWMLQSVLVDGADVTHKSFDLGNRTELTNVAITVTNKVTSVSGQVADDRGQSAGEYVVVMVPVETYEPGVMALRVKAVRPDPDGTFTVRKMMPGRYLAVAAVSLEQGREFSPEFQQQVRRLGQEFTLREGENRTLTLRITPDL